jgi:5-oxoprolinase (ATP-hydrolysing) subunit A
MQPPTADDMTDPGPPARTVDLNADLGEEVTDDDALLGLVTSANVACGFHAGSPAVMRAVCEVAAARGVRVGAQVSYLDREGFGRRRTDVPRATLTAQVGEQVAALKEIALACGTEVSYLKPHGALYNRVVDDEEQALAVLAGSDDLPVLGLPGGCILDLAADAGRQVWLEGFPDRAYVSLPDGSRRLMPRDQLGAVIDDPERIATRAVLLADQVDSICVHGDGPTAVKAARAVRAALEGAGLRLEPFT